MPDADIPAAVRETGIDPVELSVPAGRLPETVAAQVEELLGEVAGQVAVIAPWSWRDRVAPAVAGERALLVDPLSTKGLEYDATVVVDPDAIVAESPGGIRALYVVLTRAAHRTAILRPVDEAGASVGGGR